MSHLVHCAFMSALLSCFPNNCIRLSVFFISCALVFFLQYFQPFVEFFFHLVLTFFIHSATCVFLEFIQGFVFFDFLPCTYSHSSTFFGISSLLVDITVVSVILEELCVMGCFTLLALEGVYPQAPKEITHRGLVLIMNA